MSETAQTPIEIGLNAVIVAVEKQTPLVLAVHSATESSEADSLPFGPFDPLRHRTFEIGLRSWVEEQTSLKLGYVEQLYTFGDRGRHARHGDAGHTVSVGYLALARRDPAAEPMLAETGARWRPWYDFFPWEDWRAGEPAILAEIVLPRLKAWVEADPRLPRPDGRSAGRTVSARPSGCRTARGTKSGRSTATNSSTRPDWWPRRSVTGAVA